MLLYDARGQKSCSLEVPRGRAGIDGETVRQVSAVMEIVCVVTVV